MQRLELPEKAIRAFEQIHRLHVTVHDLRGTFAPAISRERFQHRHHLCQCVKAAGGDRHCVNFEIVRLRANISAFPEGRYHVCHAGLLEWMAPIYDDLGLEAVVFAGVRRAGAKLGSVHRAPLTRWHESPWDARTPLPAEVDRDEAQLILEHLLQLTARLRDWSRQRRNLLTGRRKTPSGPIDRFTDRRLIIRRFIEATQASEVRLKDLARELNVSEDRATHVVRECCGQTFRDMLAEARLKTARELLRFSALPILEVALCCGFNEITHFNRLFQRRVGCAPGAYRRRFSEHRSRAATRKI